MFESEPLPSYNIGHGVVDRVQGLRYWLVTVMARHAFGETRHWENEIYPTDTYYPSGPTSDRLHQVVVALECEVPLY